MDAGNRPPVVAANRLPAIAQAQAHSQNVPPPPAGSVNIHPAMIAKFLEMTPEAQQHLARMQPAYYQQIVNTIARQTMQERSASPPPQAHTAPLPSNDQLSAFYDTVTNYPRTEHDPSQELLALLPPPRKSGSRSRHRKQPPLPPPPPQPSSESESSDLENIHSSEEDMPTPLVSRHHNKHQQQAPAQAHSAPVHSAPVHSAPAHQSQTQAEYLSLDFRNDLTSVDDECYILGFPSQHNVTDITLTSCIIHRNQMLEREPYLYIHIEELEGNYKIGHTGKHSHSTHNVFGKLIQERNINDFIVYRPEHCAVTLPRPIRLDRLSMKFLNHDLSPVSLGRLIIKKLSRSKDCLKVTTKVPHYLMVGDRINISCSSDDMTSVDSVEVVDVLSPDLIAVENPVNNIGSGIGLQFDKTDIKCTLTFKKGC